MGGLTPELQVLAAIVVAAIIWKTVQYLRKGAEPGHCTIWSSALRYGVGAPGRSDETQEALMSRALWAALGEAVDACEAANDEYAHARRRRHARRWRRRRTSTRSVCIP